MAVKATTRRTAAASNRKPDSVDDEAVYSASQLQPLLQALQATRQGDFSSRLPNIKNGILAEIYKEFNEVISLNQNMAQEVVRLGKIVGREGKMTERASLRGASGSWAVSIDSINSLVEDLARPTTEVARVITAVANGDLTQKMALEIQGTPVKGEFLRIGTTVNTMVDQLSSFADEVTRVAREVGTEGKLGGQAKVKGVSGTWKDLTDNVNLLAGNLTIQLRDVSKVSAAIASGDLTQKITVDVKGEILQIKNVINQMVDSLSTFAGEVTRVAKEVGTEGILGGQAKVPSAAGTWKDLTDNVNFMAGNLTTQVRGIAKVVTAVANGDLKQKLVVEAKGEVATLAETINSMIDTLSIFADQVTTVAREVGTEGKLGGQAHVPNVAGTWKDLTDNVNSMASNLTGQVRNIALVTTAVANGDLSQKITVDVKGEILELKNTINVMVDQLNSFADEVTRVAKEVGTEGKLGGQAEVKGVSGTWKDLTDNVNILAGNLTNQVRDIALVTTSVANGDLSKKITVDVKGEVLELKNTINVMVDQLSSFADEVTRVAKEVGTEGKLGGQAEVKGVSGTWKDLTDNVNILAGNLTNQVRNIALVTTAVAMGDLSQKITVDASGEILELKDTINIMVDQLNSFAAEVTRVAKEVGTEGKLGGQAEVKGVSGTWKDLTDNVNFMAGNLTDQVRDIALVTTAVANGDLSKKITVDVKGEILELKDTINVMVDQLSSFADEVTRVAREVGTEGKLGGQAEVRGVSGTWKDLTDNVNILAGNLTNQVRNIALVTTAVANGDLSQKITVNASGEILELKDTINTMVDQLNSFAAEVTRVAKEVGTEGKLGGQAEVKGVSGTWKDLTDNVNFMAGNLTTQVRGIVKVVTAVANGDLSQKLVVEAKGEVAALADTINGMIDTLSIFADQVTTVAREVGTEGILGGQAKVPNTAGTWKELTDNVNFMAGNLTTQVRGIAKIVTAVANGDLKQKLAVEAKGEVAALTDTINGMIDTLSIFADQVTTVAREVGTEGILGGQAKVPNAAGTWKELTDNVNFMANSLTVQVRAISDVATAVTEGDLTRSIMVEAQGEVSDLKNKINQMIGNLKDTTGQNQEQDWLKTNLARFSRMMQGQKTLESVARLIMSEVTPLVSAHHGVFYINDSSSPEALLKLLSSYAYRERKHVSNTFLPGEGLIGQCALEKKTILLTNVPKDYIQINSGLGEATPLNIVALPVLFEGELMAVIELASFQPFSEIHMTFLEQLMESIGVVLNMIAANMRTEELLEQSQSLTQELQSQSQELQSRQEQLTHTNSELESQARELEEKAALLAEQNMAVETKNQEVELARGALEEKAQQLALSSKYKSEFLANMSHELRTPLNSMLILAKLMADNQEGNLTGKQVEFASTIHGSGTDLLNLINEILDLSKVESGKMEVDVSDIALLEVREQLMRSFEPIASQKGLEFSVDIKQGTPPTMRTDIGRLQQVLKNLLSNALKFTEKGQVSLEIRLDDTVVGTRKNRVIAFAVSDTGIGIAPSKQKLIFEAFQQADGTTSRRYGGTGLGLSISREIARLLGGTIQIESEPGKGSTFTFFVPEFFEPKESDLVAFDGFSGMDDDFDFPGNGSVPTYGNRTVLPLSRNIPQLADGTPDTSELPEITVFDALNSTNELNDDRDSIEAGDRVVLLIEDDINFARILLDTARHNGFKALVATAGDVGLSMARHYRPSAIALDLQLPVMDGWSVLDQLKRDPETRAIPVQVISVADRQHGAIVSAIAYLQKPVSHEALEGAFRHISDFLGRDARQLLIVEDDEVQRNSMIELIGNRDVYTTAVGTGAEALATLAENPFDCVILDLGLPDMEGFEVLKKIKKQAKFRDLPVVIYTSKDLSKREETQLKKYAATILSKDVQSAEKLLDQTSLFLHRVVRKLPLSHPVGAEEIPLKARAANRITPVEDKNKTTNTPAPENLKGRKILVVDDDVRNVFALTSVLENYGLQVVYAENGNSCLDVLQANTDVDAILMDVMMPEMDGYETTRTLRALPGYSKLPVIALTAKAMQGDREKCLAAGATDYIPKPVDTDLLLTTLSRLIAENTDGDVSSGVNADGGSDADGDAKS